MSSSVAISHFSYRMWRIVVSSCLWNGSHKTVMTLTNLDLSFFFCGANWSNKTCCPKSGDFFGGLSWSATTRQCTNRIISWLRPWPWYPGTLEVNDEDLFSFPASHPWMPHGRIHLMCPFFVLCSLFVSQLLSADTVRRKEVPSCPEEPTKTFGKLFNVSYPSWKRLIFANSRKLLAQNERYDEWPNSTLHIHRSF